MKRFRGTAIFRSARFWFGMVYLTSRPTSWISGLPEEITCLLLKGAAAIVCRKASQFKAQALKFSILSFRQPLVRARWRTWGRNRRKLGQSTTQILKVATYRSKLNFCDNMRLPCAPQKLISSGSTSTSASTPEVRPTRTLSRTSL